MFRSWRHIRPVSILRQPVVRPPRTPYRTFHATPSRHAYYYEHQRRPLPNILVRWVQSSGFYYQIGGAGALAGGVYIYNLEEVPISGRRRFNVVSEEMVLQSADQAYQQTLQQFRGRILPESHQAHRMVQRVMQRLIPHIKVPEGSPPTDWRVHVVAADEPNAFVLPGGKVFVLTGILPICKGEDGLAAVLGHEIAHNLAGHVAEKMSAGMIYSGLAFALQVVALFFGLPYTPGLANGVIDLGLAKPNSRKQESEADYIGLLLMSEACYDPHAASAMWNRMDQMERQMGNHNAAFLSTHPASHDRMEAIERWMPKAEAKREENGCAAVSSYNSAFSQAFKRYA